MSDARTDLIIALIQVISEISTGNAEIDGKLALLCGWKRRSGSDEGAVVWLHDNYPEGRLPSFSSSTEDALKLLSCVRTEVEYGVSYVASEKLSTCTLNEREFWTARTLPAAISIAALSTFLSDEDKRRQRNFILKADA